MEVKKEPVLDPGLLKEILDLIIKEYSPEKVIIFGSRSRGDCNKNSDIDIAIQSNKQIIGLKEMLDENIKTLLKFDVVDLSKANENFKERILKEGIIIYEKKG